MVFRRATDLTRQKVVIFKEARERLREGCCFHGKAAACLMESSATEREGELRRHAGSCGMKCKYDDCCLFHGR